MIRRFDEDIRKVVVDDADFYFVRERFPISNTPSKWRLNAGVYVMRNSPAARELLDEAIAREEYVNHEWWDQAAISAIFGYWSVFHKPHEHKPDDPSELSRRICWIAPKWNASPVYDPEPNAIVHHFYGLRGQGKVVAMEIDSALNKFGERTTACSQTLTTILQALEPSLRVGMLVAAPRAASGPFVEPGMKALRRRPWRLWTGRRWAKRQFAGSG